MVREGQASAVRTIFVKAVFFLRGRPGGDVMGRKHARQEAGGRKHPDAVDGALRRGSARISEARAPDMNGMTASAATEPCGERFSGLRDFLPREAAF